MRYEEFDPFPDGAPWVANFWRFEVDGGDPPAFEHVIVPDGTLSISLMLAEHGPIGPIVFAGPSTTAHRVPVHRGVVYVGVRLHPAAAGPLLGLDGTAIAGRIGLLAAVAPAASELFERAVQPIPGDAGIAARALDSAVKSLAERATAPEPSVVRAVDILLERHGSATLSQLAAETGISERQLRRKFRAHVGLSPKEFARTRRIRHACILMLQAEEAELAGLSQDGGYADQPHLSREFRGIFGSSPRLVETYLRRIEHVAVKD
jgi:AraC-like DNA-binding protein